METLISFKGQRKTRVSLQELTNRIEQIKGVDSVVLVDWNDTRDKGHYRLKGNFNLNKVNRTILSANYVLN